MTELSEITAAMLRAAKVAGADSADCLVIEGQSLSVDVREGKLEHAERAEGTDAGLRVFVGQRQATVSTSDMRPEIFRDLAERAVAIATDAPEDPHAGIADPTQIATDRDASMLEISDPEPDPTPETLEQRALAAEGAARDVKGVRQVDTSSAGFSRHKIHLAASNGFSGGYARSSHSISCVAICGEGTAMDRDYHHDSRVFGADLTSPEEIGRTAGERAAAREGARKPKTGAFPVLFDERISGSLVGHLLSAINGEAIARGASWLRDALGDAVLPDALTLTANPRRPRITGSRPFDGEGLATSAWDIVAEGILTGWVLDLATARRLGLESNANASRSIATPPRPSAGNVALVGGTKSRGELLNEMGTGLLVTSMIGSTINPNTGDYSRGASGFWVEDGEVQYPVNECTIAGNLRDMLMTVTAGNDARHHLSRVVPSLLVEGMTLAGE